MTALAADRVTTSKGKLRRQRYKVAASTVIYAGGMVCCNASGYAVPAANTAGFSDVVGIATAKADNSAGLDGAIDVIVEYGPEGAFLLDVHASITQADVGRDAYVTDDQTVCDLAQSTNDIKVGRILEYLDESQDKAWVVIANVAGAAGVTFDAARVFISAETTGTGSSQNVAHGLGVAPAGVLIVPTEHPGTPDTGAFDIAEGSHDATNVVVTVTANVKFKAFAWA